MDIEEYKKKLYKMDDKALKVEQVALLVELMYALHGIRDSINKNMSAIAHEVKTIDVSIKRIASKK